MKQVPVLANPGMDLYSSLYIGAAWQSYLQWRTTEIQQQTPDTLRFEFTKLYIHSYIGTVVKVILWNNTSHPNSKTLNSAAMNFTVLQKYSINTYINYHHFVRSKWKIVHNDSFVIFCKSFIYIAIVRAVAAIREFCGNLGGKMHELQVICIQKDENPNE